MKVKILQDGRYNNADRTAIDCTAGQDFETSAAYAAVLIETGLAEAIENSEAVAEVVEKKPKPAKKTGKETPAKKTNPNPFVS